MAEFFSRPVVCNTGPIIGLSRAGLCHLFGELFPVFFLPQAVVTELRIKEASDALEIEKAIAAAHIIESAQLPDPLLQAELDLGEASVIQTAREIPNAGVLIDERRARRIASAVYGLEVKGTCALLVEAKRRSLIDRVHPVLNSMLAGGYFIGPQLMAACLAQAGE